MYISAISRTVEPRKALNTVVGSESSIKLPNDNIKKLGTPHTHYAESNHKIHSVVGTKDVPQQVIAVI